MKEGFVQLLSLGGELIGDFDGNASLAKFAKTVAADQGVRIFGSCNDPRDAETGR